MSFLRRLFYLRNQISAATLTLADDVVQVLNLAGRRSFKAPFNTTGVLLTSNLFRMRLSPQITLQIWQSENQTHYFYKPLKSTSSFTTSDVTANIIENIKTFTLLSTNEVIWVQHTPKWGFLGSSAGKESACNAGNPSLIPGSGRSPREGIGYPLQYSWASVAAQMVKNLPIM